LALAQLKLARFSGEPWSVQLTMSADDQTRHSFIVK
jgi:hypothetical protein